MCRYGTDEDIKEMIDKEVAQQKKGMLTDQEIELMMRGWKSEREKGDLDEDFLAKEIELIEKKFEKYNVHTSSERRWNLYFLIYSTQLSSKEIRQH